MKRSFPGAVLFFSVIVSLALPACTKKKTEDCKICKALPAGPDQPPVEKKICSSDEEQAFRNQYAGRTIICR